MDWKERIVEIEDKLGLQLEIDWKPYINSIDFLLSEILDSEELYIRSIYVLHNILVEEKYSDNDEEYLTHMLRKWFLRSEGLFSNNSEYMFFIGKILHISGWYFGLDGNQLAFNYQRKAMESEPRNLLYEWAYRFSCASDIVEGYLANKLVENEKEKIDWLKSKGFAGEYILEHLNESNINYLENNPRKGRGH